MRNLALLSRPFPRFIDIPPHRQSNGRDPHQTSISATLLHIKSLVYPPLGLLNILGPILVPYRQSNPS